MLHWASKKNNFWVMELDGCSFQAPHALPRLRPMERHISLSSFSSSSLLSLNASSTLPLELEIHIWAIFYHYLVFSFLSFFHYKCHSNSPARVGDSYLSTFYLYLASFFSGINVSPILPTRVGDSYSFSYFCFVFSLSSFRFSLRIKQGIKNKK